MAAALSYYTMLSLSPLLVIAVTTAGLIFGDQLAQSELLEQIGMIMTPEIADTFRTILRNSSRVQRGIIAGSISMVVLFFGASGAFAQLYDTLNVIWNVNLEQRSGIGYLVRQRLLGFLMVLLIGLLLTASMVLGATVTILSTRFANLVPEVVDWLSWIQRWSTLLVIPFLFMALFKLLPARKIAWRDVWLGGLLTGGAFILSRQLIGLYLQTSSVTSVYGAAGSLVILLIWVYFSSMIMFFGAAFCRVYAEMFGSLREPSNRIINNQQPIDH